MVTCCVCKTREGEIYPQFSQVLTSPVCEICLFGKGDYRNNQRIGLPSRLPPFSIEFEIHGPRRDCERALALLGHGYLRTEDGTVSDEYKSPIYCSLAAFRNHLPVLHTLRGLVDEKCGTHLHVGFPSLLVHRLIGMRNEIFLPLRMELENDTNRTERFWGRYFCHYAREYFFDSYPWLRFPTSHDTLEYRLPRFHDAAQYLEVVRFCRRTTYFLQQSMVMLEKISGPLDENAEAAGQHLTSQELGHQILAYYREALHRLDYANTRLVQSPLAAS